MLSSDKDFEGISSNEGPKTYYCLSTDTKPVNNVINGSFLFELDTSKTYFFNKSTASWIEFESSGGGGGSSIIVSKSITANGTYNASSDSADGYNPVVVNVSGGRGVTILSGIIDPTSSQGNNGQIYLKDVSNPIPGYSKLEYLEVTTAGPYIDTEVVNDSTAYFEVNAQYTSTPENNYGLFGSMSPAKEFVVNAYGSEAYFEAGSTRGVFTSSATAPHIFEGKSDGLYLDRVLLNPNVNWGNATGLTYYLFAFHYYQSPGIYKTANAKIFGCKLYNGAVLVRDFIPVMRLSDSELGMLDLVNSRFYSNDGDGVFVAGPVMSGVSQAYAKVNGVWQDLIGTDISNINLGN